MLVKMMNIQSIYRYLLLIILALFPASCQRGAETGVAKPGLMVVATLFPLYDFAKAVGGDKAKVTLLLPPGAEPHSFEPRPQDIKTLQEADIFIFTNPAMEPWALDLTKGVSGKNLLIIDTSQGLDLISLGDEHPGCPPTGQSRRTARPEKTGQAKIDPHVWLDLMNAAKMIDRILAGFIAQDPAHEAYYRANADRYKKQLIDLDERFLTTLKGCKTRIIISGGHAAFGYLARRYGLTYLSAYHISPDAEPKPRELVNIIRHMKKHGTKYVFHEELIEPRVARMLAQETGAQLLMLHGAHNITKEEFDKGTSFLSLMEMNLKNLQVGLECP